MVPHDRHHNGAGQGRDQGDEPDHADPRQGGAHAEGQDQPDPGLDGRRAGQDPAVLPSFGPLTAPPAHDQSAEHDQGHDPGDGLTDRRRQRADQPDGCRDVAVTGRHDRHHRVPDRMRRDGDTRDPRDRPPPARGQPPLGKQQRNEHPGQAVEQGERRGQRITARHPRISQPAPSMPIPKQTAVTSSSQPYRTSGRRAASSQPSAGRSRPTAMNAHCDGQCSPAACRSSARRPRSAPAGRPPRSSA